MLTKQDEVQVRTYSGTEIRIIGFKEGGYLELMIDDGFGERASVLMNEVDVNQFSKAFWISAETALDKKEDQGK